MVFRYSGIYNLQGFHFPSTHTPDNHYQDKLQAAKPRLDDVADLELQPAKVESNDN